MRTALLIVLALAASGIALAPTASAEPCEVPGCNVAGAALCFVAHAKDLPKRAVATAEICLTQTA